MELGSNLPVVAPDYWGHATSTIDWCEENYVVCKYIAEFWNTVTNLAFFSLAIFGMWKVRSTRQENRFLLCYMGMLIVGLGSADVKAGTDVYVSLALFAYSTIVTLVYLHIRKPVFHQVAYGIEIFVVLVRSTMHQIEIRKTNLRAYAEMQQLFGLGVAAFGVAFALWNIDNIFCSNLRAIRNALPMVLAPFFQLHAYWHIGTAIGCYASIVYQQYLRLVMLGTMDNYRLRKAAFIVPYIDRVRKDE
ncbi:hypothetical protein GGH93_000824 [Coemansia aciculifera]|nr:hypothetical protein GGH93_000824 [Coemansia aciculifera]